MAAVIQTRRTATGTAGKQTRIIFGLAVLAALAAGLWAYSAQSASSAMFGVFGLAFGFVLQRSRFCFASSFRDLWLMQDGRMMRAVISGMAIATLGFALVEYNLVPSLATGQRPVGSALTFVGPHLLVGGLLFGIGMVIAGGCVSGNLYRIGEGYVASWVALLGILVGLGAALFTYNWWWDAFIGASSIVWLPAWLGWGGAVAVTLAGLFAAYLLVMRVEAGGPPHYAPRRAAAADERGFRSELAQMWRTVFQQGWTATAGAVTLALLNILFYMYQRPVGVTGELQRWSAGFASSIGFPPPLPPTDDLGACGIVTASGFLAPTLFLTGGLVFGSFVAATLSGEFKIRIPNKRSRFVQSFAGGTLMGYASALAAGCTLGGFFSAVPSLGLNGWVFAVGLLGGSWVGVRLLKYLP